MAKRMLIDAAHAEETRVVVVDGNKLEEFDTESAARTLLKGNIYLAKVTRVEPSLQAAFVEYGGERHGFLAFNEIHPDYYQIPVSDRRALLEQQAAADAGVNGADSAAAGEAPGNGADSAVETVSGQEEDEVARRSPPPPRYRIQEVIKRRQILLVQVTKEERGNKGAALTTYISLAGRYCVLMPNTTRGGGISRKIQSADARKRLRSVVGALDVPAGMAVILRTAGQNRTKAEIKRDYDYLLRLWEQIRQATLASTAPALIHEEANLIKRSIRDLYSSEIEEVLVEGDEGYRTAKSFMRTLMPSHAKRVQPYRERMPLFTRYRVEGPLDSMHSATVPLPSGGYIVLCPTEALVAIDVNSGRATRERGIEETATKTNLEAASEIARQLRLRDLAGLIVIDFIDMAESRNARAVEKRLKEAVQSDRARIQMGRVSGFGLLELSRQRLRPSFQEISSAECPHCAGSGRVRSIESTTLQALRAIEEEGVRGRAARVKATVPMDVALYLMNRKRAVLAAVEARYDLSVSVEVEDSDGPRECRIDMLEARTAPAPAIEAPAAEAPAGQPEAEAAPDSPPPKRRSRRRGHGANAAGRATELAGDTAAEPETPAEGAVETPDAPDAPDAPEAAEANGAADDEKPRRRRRGRRGGRRQARARAAEAAGAETEAAAAPEAALAETVEAEQIETAPAAAEAPAEPETAPAVAEVDGKASIVRPERRRRRRKAPAEAAAPPPDAVAEAAPEAMPESPAESPAPNGETAMPDDAPAAEAPPADAPVAAKPAGDTLPANPKRRRRAPAKAKSKPAKDEAPRANGDIAAPPEPAPEAMPDAVPVEAIPAEAVPAAADAPVSGRPPAAPRRGWWQPAPGAS